MFEKRLRIFLLIIFLGGCLLAGRAAQVQVVQRDEWTAQAASAAERVAYVPARRGDLLDVKGRVIATDVPSFEASVNFCVVGRDPDAKWLREEATRRARRRGDWPAADADARALIVAEEQQGVRSDLEGLWSLLAEVSRQTPSQVDATRDGILFDVAQKQEAHVSRQYDAALASYIATPRPRWYVRWVAGTPARPDLDAFRRNPKLVIGDQFAFHTVLPDLTQAQYNAIAIAQERLPQMQVRGEDGKLATASVLKLRPAVRRSYPFDDIACHVIGRVGMVSKEDRDRDPNKGDKLRGYALNDRIGRDGLEALAEPLLRGVRGQTTRDRGGRSLQADTAVAGANVRTSLDIVLQSEIQRAFDHVLFEERDAEGQALPRTHIPMNGAAVVIDLKTAQVRALVSVPTFDLNRFDELYEQLEDDDVRRPMVNRALLDAIEPGSSVKPIVGLGAITQKLGTAEEAIECTGYLLIDGKRIEKPRCWTMSMFGKRGLGAHHVVPANAPHRDGHLGLADAVERSCNVYFSTLGDRLGVEGLSHWMRQFGFGQPTGIGLPEAYGVVPTMTRMPTGERRSIGWYSSIGQGHVLATPIQVCNEIATIARDGVWRRPRLTVDPLPAPPPSTRPTAAELRPDRLDLRLDPAALRAVREGMKNVVNSPAGTGKEVRRDDVKIAAKTGSATATPLIHYLRDERGKLVLDPQTRRPQYDVIPYGSGRAPHPKYPWYRLSGYDEATGRAKGTHSWVVGYAPADDPQIAFCVYVEYGGSGGIGAASVAQVLLESCQRNGYLATVAPTVAPTVRPVLPPTIARPVDDSPPPEN